MAEKVDFSKVHFLIVDGNALSADLARDLLLTMGAKTVFVAHNFDEGLEVLGSGSVDVLLTELHLPPRSGLDLIRAVRDGKTRASKQMPILVMSAMSAKEHVFEARDAGVTEFIAKPYGVEGFYRRMVGIVARPRAFVDTNKYFGPDRRRRQVPFDGQDRRE
ncbi:response regulator [uncultured Nisaea sp.]|jgi:two-component system, chemotaxis family, chemotaxis protein CheY|uniref:response regulator n=1 Tax=uncultured Nisaea sp. TaxID=538215 RepID=UPI0030EC2D5F|tara:strand:- start:792 stop:1277 length:486 start_codon:yes stop_codon:yes gene_type:complete